MRVLGVIPARGGSKRVPRKNLRQLYGRPLIQYTIEAAARSEKLTTWVVSTEDYEIGRVASDLGAYVVRRPEELAQDDTRTGPVLLHTLEWMEPDPFDMVVCLHPTSPIRDPKHIDEAIDLLRDSGQLFDCVASCCALPTKSHPNVFPESGQPSYGGDILNGSIYVIKRDWLKRNGRHVSCDPLLMPMDRRHSVDIDEEIDLKLAEFLLEQQ